MNRSIFAGRIFWVRDWIGLLRSRQCADSLRFAVASPEDGRLLEELAASVGCRKEDHNYSIYRQHRVPLVLDKSKRPAGFLFAIDTLESKSIWAMNYLLDGTDLDEIVRTCVCGFDYVVMFMNVVVGVRC